MGCLHGRLACLQKWSRLILGTSSGLTSWAKYIKYPIFVPAGILISLSVVLVTGILKMTEF